MEPFEIPSDVQVALVGLLGALLGVVASWIRQVLRARRKGAQEQAEASAKRVSAREELLDEHARAVRLVLLQQQRKAYAALLASAVTLQAEKSRLLSSLSDPDTEAAAYEFFRGIENPYFELLTASKVVDLVSEDEKVLDAGNELLFDAMLVTGHGDSKWMHQQDELFEKSRRTFAAVAGDDIYRLEIDVRSSGSEDAEL